MVKKVVAVALLSLCAGAEPDVTLAFPNITIPNITIPNITIPNITIPANVSEFMQGCADAFGFRSFPKDVPNCVDDVKASTLEFYTAIQDFRTGGWYMRGKAIVHASEGLEDFLYALKPCIASVDDALRYKSLMAELSDSRFYTRHNTATLLLNAFEERAEFEKFAADWEVNYYNAGKDFTQALLDVIANPGIPSTGRPATNFLRGFVSGFVPVVNLDCLYHGKVAFPAVIKGVWDLVDGNYEGGLESIFTAFQSIVPTFKACLKDAKELIHFVKLYRDFKYPKQMAAICAQNIRENAVDISLQSGSAVLALQGKEWMHLGKSIGGILEMVVVGDAKAFDFVKAFDIIV